MKVIVSHDIDHLYWSEHLLKDLYLQKYIAKSCIYVAKGGISFNAFAERMAALTKARLHRIPELIEFDKSYGIKSTFFVAVKNGLGLSYSQKNAKKIIEFVLQQGCDVGLHGMAYNSFSEMEKEHNLFKELSGLESFGIRNHYLRKSENTLQYMSALKYAFDSTTYEIKNPYQVNQMTEFPITMMDAYMVKETEKNIHNAIERTKASMSKVFETNVNLITINFHDPYLSEAYSTYRDWYMWVIDWLRSQKIEFTTFNKEL